MKLRFYFDDDSAEGALIDALRMRGIEVCVPGDADLAGADDARHLAWCAEHDFVLVTHNISDFWALHGSFLAQGKSHCGIVLVRQQALSIGARLRRLLNLWGTLSADDMKNQAEFLSDWA